MGGWGVVVERHQLEWGSFIFLGWFYFSFGIKLGHHLKRIAFACQYRRSYSNHELSLVPGLFGVMPQLAKPNNQHVRCSPETDRIFVALVLRNIATRLLVLFFTLKP